MYEQKFKKKNKHKYILNRCTDIFIVLYSVFRAYFFFKLFQKQQQKSHNYFFHYIKIITYVYASIRK